MTFWCIFPWIDMKHRKTLWAMAAENALPGLKDRHLEPKRAGPLTSPAKIISGWLAITMLFGGFVHDFSHRTSWNILATSNWIGDSCIFRSDRMLILSSIPSPRNTMVEIQWGSFFTSLEPSKWWCLQNHGWEGTIHLILNNRPFHGSSHENAMKMPFDDHGILLKKKHIQIQTEHPTVCTHQGSTRVSPRNQNPRIGWFLGTNM